MNESYLNKAEEILELKINDMISNDDVADAIEEIVKKYPEQSEKVNKIMEEIGYVSGIQKTASKNITASSVEELKRQISSLPKPLAISLAALLISVAPGATSWASEISGVKSKDSIVKMEGKTYIVQTGDNFEKIAKRHNVTINELQRANPGVDSRKLRIGQKLNIPEENQNIVFDSGKYGIYLVRGGDTLSSIAKKFGVTVSHLKEINGFSDVQANNLKVKQEIKTFDFDRMVRAFIYVETYQIPNDKKDIAIGDNSEALGCLQFHIPTFKEGAKAAGITVSTNDPGEGEWWKGDDRTNREKCVKAFEGILKKYKPLSVEEILKKAHWNSGAKVNVYLNAYNNGSGSDIPLK